MLRRLFDLVFKDLWWKLASLAVAFGLWFVGTNIANPVMNKVFVIGLDTSNLNQFTQDDIVVLNLDEVEATKISVTLRGTKNELASLDEMCISARLEIRDIDREPIRETDYAPAYFQADVSVVVLPGYDVEQTSRWPFFVELRLDQFVRQQRPVFAFYTGDVAEGYVVRSCEAEHGFVTISGAKSVVEKVQTIQAQTNAFAAEASFSKLEPLHAFDEDKNDITGMVGLSESSTTVSVTVQPFKTVLLSAPTTGVPPPGYEFIGVSYNPSTIRIVGPAETLRNVSRITLELVYLNDKTETFTEQYNLPPWLPEGVTLLEGEPFEAQATFAIEPKIERTFELKPGEIEIRDIAEGATARIHRSASISV
ncbi:MAG: CdaR family protein, partial [Defluviitaleaceae bacterium]|nr:CdaR family protein [Defluviitaleaceae bacterium]